MNFETILSFTLTLSLFLAGPAAEAKQSISDLPTLSKLLIHHFECTGLLVIAGSSKEEKFTFAPVGGQHPQGSAVVNVGDDTLETSGNSQMLNLDWKRSGKLIASSMMMIKKSPTEAYTLIVADPGNDGNQGSVMCLAVTYSDLKSEVRP